MRCAAPISLTHLGRRSRACSHQNHVPCHCWSGLHASRSFASVHIVNNFIQPCARRGTALASRGLSIRMGDTSRSPLLLACSISILRWKCTFSEWNTTTHGATPRITHSREQPKSGKRWHEPHDEGQSLPILERVRTNYLSTEDLTVTSA